MNVTQLKTLISMRQVLVESDYECLNCLSKLFVDCDVDVNNYEEEFINTVLDRAVSEVEADRVKGNPKRELKLAIIKGEFEDMYNKWKIEQQETKEVTG